MMSVGKRRIKRREEATAERQQWWGADLTSNGDIREKIAVLWFVGCGLDPATGSITVGR